MQSFLHPCLYPQFNVIVDHNLRRIAQLAWMNYSQAIKINIVDQSFAKVSIYVNQTSPFSPIVQTQIKATVGQTYQFNLRDKVTILIKSSSNSSDEFVNFAQFSFKVYIDTYSSADDKSIKSQTNSTSNSTNSTTDASTTTASSNSIFDTYSVYFNSQSYKVTMIVIGFSIAIISWMIVLSIIACIYRRFLEKKLCPVDYEVRMKSNQMRRQKEDDEEKILKEMQKHENHHSTDDNHHAKPEDPEAKFLQSSNQKTELEQIDFTPDYTQLSNNPTPKSAKSRAKDRKGLKNSLPMQDITMDDFLRPNNSVIASPVLSPQSVQNSTRSKTKKQAQNETNQETQISKINDDDVEEINILKEKKKLNKKKKLPHQQFFNQQPQNFSTLIDFDNQFEEQTPPKILKSPMSLNQREYDLEKVKYLSQKNKSYGMSQNTNQSNQIILREESVDLLSSSQMSLEKIDEENESVTSSVHLRNLGVAKMRNTAKSNFSKAGQSEIILENENQLEEDDSLEIQHADEFNEINDSEQQKQEKLSENDQESQREVEIDQQNQIQENYQSNDLNQNKVNHEQDEMKDLEIKSQDDLEQEQKDQFSEQEQQDNQLDQNQQREQNDDINQEQKHSERSVEQKLPEVESQEDYQDDFENDEVQEVALKNENEQQNENEDDSESDLSVKSKSKTKEAKVVPINDQEQ
ncbi:UNKNOWN [Stylonychia lemnae]|uniref:Transmembrane protein n=1 Tax=Stylonychia lemnae TaxID=5949 RepID=A0A077ZXY9_STYLE|nr:UNKNOWN [Stylonychia lemnae]|eukprot:CDW74467.1 UNKNOWN [Stylonychia lemnae]